MRLLSGGGTWKMTYNTEKCKHLHIGKNKDISSYTMTEDNKTTTVEKVLYVKDLEVTTDNSSSFTEHINSKISIANRNTGIIFKSFTYMDKDVFLTLYESIVRPHLEYASCIWALYHKKDSIALENVQRHATKMVSKLKNLS